MANNSNLNLMLINDYKNSLGQAVIEKMLMLYCTQASGYLEKIDSAKERGNEVDWQESCHKMKSAAGSIGLVDVHGHLNAMETTPLAYEEKLAAYEKLTELNAEGISAFKLYNNI